MNISITVTAIYALMWKWNYEFTHTAIAVINKRLQIPTTLASVITDNFQNGVTCAAAFLPNTNHPKFRLLYSLIW